MSHVKKLFWEIAVSSFLLVMFDALLTGILVFCFFFLALAFFRIDSLYAGVAAAVFFLISLIRKIRRNKILELENNYPELREKLRTSNDHKDTENMVVLALHEEVMNTANKVDVGTLLNLKKVFIKAGGISAMLFLILIMSVYNVDYYRLTEHVKSIPFLNDIQARLPGGKVGIKEATEFNEDGKLAKLGDDQINLSLDIYNTELDMNQINPPEKNDYGGSFPEEVMGSAQESYNEKITEEHKETVKEYFNKINR